MSELCWLHPQDEETPFPPVENALREPDGLLAVGGSLSPQRLVDAYRRGIFPWYSEGQPVLWWSPDPRSVLFPDKLRVSRSLAKTLRRGVYRVTLDQAFEPVIRACSEPRTYQQGTWITPEVLQAYVRLHKLGIAHSVETWCGDELVGGLYGLGIGKVFFGESMFSRRTDASKVALVRLVEQLRAWGYALIDCQVQSEHLDSLGAQNIPRKQFIRLLRQHCEAGGEPAPWRLDDEHPR